MNDEIEKLPNSLDEAESRMRQLRSKLDYLADQLSEDFENVVIISRKIWRIDDPEHEGPDMASKIYFSIVGDPMVSKSLMDILSNDIRDNLSTEVEYR